MNIEEFKALVGDVQTSPAQAQQPVPQEQQVPLVATDVQTNIAQPDQSASVGISIPGYGNAQVSTQFTEQETISTPSDMTVGVTIPGYGTSVEQTVVEETQPQTSNLEQFSSGINEGLANILGLPGDLSAAVTNLGAAGINAALGTDLPTQTPALFGSQAIEETVLDPFISEVDPQTGTQRYLRAGGRAVGQSVVPVTGTVGQAARPVRTAAQIAAAELGAETGAQIAEDIAPDSVVAQVVGSILGAFAPTSAIRTSRRINNIVRRVANSGNARDIATAKRVLSRISRNSPDSVTERDVVEAIARDTRLARYLAENTSGPNVSALVINSAAGDSPNTLQSIRETAVLGATNPRTGEVNQSLVRQTLEDVNNKVDRLGAMTENSLSNLTPSRLAEISKDLASGEGGRIFERQLTNKIAEFIDNDTEFLASAGYRAGDTPIIWFDKSTGVPYLIKKKNGQLPNDLSNVPPEERVSVFNAPTLENAAGNILTSVRSEIDAQMLRDFREGPAIDQQLAADVFAPASRRIAETIGESSPLFRETSSRQRAARVAQEALRGAARGEGTNALQSLRTQIETLNPNDPLLEVIDRVEFGDDLNLSDIANNVREIDILTRVGSELNPTDTGVDYINQAISMAGQAVALGGKSTLTNANAGRAFARALIRKNIPGKPSKKELSDAEVINYMLDLTSNRERFSEVFNRLREESTEREFTDTINNLVAFLQPALAVGDVNEDLASQLGAQ